MDSAKQAIKDKINSSTIEEARIFVATYHGQGEYLSFAKDCLAIREAALRDSKDAATLSNSHKALEISEAANAIARSALRNSTWANIIAIIAAIIAVAAIIIAWLTKN